MMRALRRAIELEIRVLGEGDEEGEKNRGDLFQGKGWQRGMFFIDDTISLSRLTARPPYRVQINVIQSRFSYALPAWNWTQENISPVLLSAIN
ncbi:MAG: hypothetical protein HY257_00985 [Chloroflexi bacterium]|nr:hypothetical protein [Chloroflexota bacterium]